MNKIAGNYNINSKKAPLHTQNGKKMELQGGRKSQSAEKTMASRRRSAKEIKMALLEDVDNLKKKLRYEENVHRALQRAFNRPLGALPRLPPYLPQSTLELLAEVAVLEEEVVRLEEQVVNFRQGIYQEAVYIFSRKSPEDSTADELSSSRSSQSKHSRSSSHGDNSLGSFRTRASCSLSSRKLFSLDSLSDSSRHCPESLSIDKHPQNESNNETNPHSNKYYKSYGERKSVKGCLSKPDSVIKNVNSPKIQCRNVEQAQESSSSSSDSRLPDVDSEANRLSEDIIKCLIKIIVRLSSSKRKTLDSESFSSLAAKGFDQNDFRDPYSQSSELRKRDIGTYKHLHSIEAHSLDISRKTNATFLIRRLKLLLNKLASVKFDGLSHQQKLAFWINIYNSCIMNAVLENGPDMIVAHMQKATIKVGGHVVNALMIEHLILRLPYHLKYTCSKSAKNNDESKICRTLGLEWSEPLVTFALSCGSWSSPAVRVYTASEIEAELETAKREYLQAAVGISGTTNKLMIPKLLDWYVLDFAKDMDSLLDWICLQLPDDVRDDAVKCLDRKGREPLSAVIQVVPYNFNFRYLVYRTLPHFRNVGNEIKVRGS
ncbi:uncharacterized protein LOC127248920 [Andrographis paniculata]|uniref:uncharacterized protein LOC127248920 n=1 Tax=Andrographis paniculata TaxID=175694 RepID=UPI0021E80AF1|nr:uncharacterized protein LOC127248920 [Andrographis paniculata]XP_051127446.1 uncharacterized protein LOC127248920 [Andrographis paniculata]